MNTKKLRRYLKKRFTELTAFQVFGLLVVFFGVVFVVRYFGRGSQEWLLIRVETAGQNWTTNYGGKDGYLPPTWVNDYVKKGLVEHGADGKETAIIDQVDVYEHGNNSKIYFDVRVRVLKNKNTDQYIFKNEPIQVGSLIHFSFPEVLLEGEVIDINPVHVHKTISVTVHLRDLEPWLIDKIKVGDTMKEVVSGRVVATVKSLKTEPSLSQIYLQSSPTQGPNNSFLVNNPRLADVVMRMDIDVEQRGGILYFAGNQMIKNSFDIFCNFGDYHLSWMEITDINE